MKFFHLIAASCAAVIPFTSAHPDPLGNARYRRANSTSTVPTSGTSLTSISSTTKTTIQTTSTATTTSKTTSSATKITSTSATIKTTSASTTTKITSATFTTTTTTLTTTTTSPTPSTCPQYGSHSRFTYPKVGPFDRYVVLCGTNFNAKSSPVVISGLGSYKECLTRCSGSMDWIAATYRPTDGNCYCFYDYTAVAQNDPTSYDGAFKIPSTSTSCTYFPPSVDRITAANQARFVLYNSSTFGASGGVVIGSGPAADSTDCANICANDSNCAFFTYGLSDKTCYRYSNSSGAGLCPSSSNVEAAGVKVTV